MAERDDELDARVLAALGAIDDADRAIGPVPDGMWESIQSAIDGPGAEPHAVASPVAPAAALPGRPAWSRRRVGAVVAAIAAVVAIAFALPIVRGAGGNGKVAARAELSSAGLRTPSPATGEAQLVRKGSRTLLDLSLHDLPPAPAGEVYEVWLLTADGSRLQSLGLTDGRGRLLVPTHVDTAQFDVVDVSREPTDGNPAHSTDSVVRGRLRTA